MRHMIQLTKTDNAGTRLALNPGRIAYVEEVNSAKGTKGSRVYFSAVEGDYIAVCEPLDDVVATINRALGEPV